MVKEDVKKRLCTALGILNKEDFYLLCKYLHERTIAHKLAEHLQKLFPSYHVDCECNRDIDSKELTKSKKLTHLKDEYITLINKLKEKKKRKKIDYGDSVSVYPDIIIHMRGTNSRNTLVIEMKISSKLNDDERNYDFLKLEYFTDQTKDGTLKYTYGVFLVLKTGKDYRYDDFISEEQWFKEGRKINDEEFLCPL